MKIAITGAAGYIGSRVALELARRGHSVLGVDIVDPQSRMIAFPPSVQFRQHDLRIPAEALAALQGVQLVVHLAADVGAMSYMREHQADILTNNAAIDTALYPALQAHNIPWIIYSSSSMVFQHVPKFPYTESDLPRINPPTNVYGFAKLIGEYFCKAYARQHGLSYTIIRYHNVYGPGEDSKGASPGDIHVIPALIEKVLEGQYPLQFLGDPPEQATRPFVYIDDAVQATVSVVEDVLNGGTRVHNEDFNIGNSTATTILELGEMIWNTCGDGRPFQWVAQMIESDTALRREVDIKKIRAALGWSPQTTLELGLTRTVDWIRKRKHLPA